MEDKQATKTKALAEKSLAPRIARALTAGKQIVIAVRREPSIDQLVAAIGLASLINKQANPARPPGPDKPDSSSLETKPNRQPTRSAVVAFSGPVPPAIGFIKTDEIISPTVDNYRELVISINKNLADKLRYSLGRKMARIHISPFLSNQKGLSAEDLEIGPGAFIIDTLVTVGVDRPADLDPIIGDHLDILGQDRQLITMVAGQDQPSQVFGPAEAAEPDRSKKQARRAAEPLHWCRPESSCSSEMIFELAKELRVELDANIATILLTGFISATNRIKLRLAGASQLETMGRLVKFAGVENKQTVITYLEDKEFPALPAAKPAEATAKAAAKSTKEQLLTEQEALNQIKVSEESGNQIKKGLGLRVATQKSAIKVEAEAKDSFEELQEVRVGSDGQIVSGSAAKPKIEPPKAQPAAAGPGPNPVTDVDKLGRSKPAPAASPVSQATNSNPASYQPSLIPPADQADKPAEAENPELAASPATT